MQSILREKLLTQAFKLAGVSNTYIRESHRFVETYFNWLEEAQNELMGLRSPISILLQSEKSTLLSVLDGNLPSNLQEGKSIRKCQKAVAAQSLEKVSKEFYTKIESIDNNFDQLGEKLCHTVAVIATKEPEFYRELKVSQQSIDDLWRKIGSTPETIPIYNYLCAKLTSTDINYLLTDIVQKAKSHT